MTVNLAKYLTLHIGVAVLFAASVFASCSKEIIYTLIEDMECFYIESSGLNEVAGDSIQRFATKVETYETSCTETKADPYYPDIISGLLTRLQIDNICKL